MFPLYQILKQIACFIYQSNIMIDYAAGRVMKLGELTPEWWI
jgi:hypothetical protein